MLKRTRTSAWPRTSSKRRIASQWLFIQSFRRQWLFLGPSDPLQLLVDDVRGTSVLVHSCRAVDRRIRRNINAGYLEPSEPHARTPPEPSRYLDSSPSPQKQPHQHTDMHSTPLLTDYFEPPSLLTDIFEITLPGTRSKGKGPMQSALVYMEMAIPMGTPLYHPPGLLKQATSIKKIPSRWTATRKHEEPDPSHPSTMPLSSPPPRAALHHRTKRGSRGS